MPLTTLSDFTSFLEYLDDADRLVIAAVLCNDINGRVAQICLDNSRRKREETLNQAFQMAHADQCLKALGKAA